MARHEAALAAMREELIRQGAALQLRRVELSAREAGLNRREAGLNRREADLNRRQAAHQDDIASQDALLGSRREDLARRETAMDTFQEALMLREATMSEKLKRAAELEERANAMGENTHADRQVMILERQVESETEQKNRLRHERANLQRTVEERDGEISRQRNKITELEAQVQGLVTEKSEHWLSGASEWEELLQKVTNRWTAFVPVIVGNEAVAWPFVGDRLASMTMYDRGSSRLETFIAESNPGDLWHCLDALCKYGPEDYRAPVSGTCKYHSVPKGRCLQIHVPGTEVNGKPVLEFRMKRTPA